MPTAAFGGMIQIPGRRASHLGHRHAESDLANPRRGNDRKIQNGSPSAESGSAFRRGQTRHPSALRPLRSHPFRRSSSGTKRWKSFSE
jgi:hypothetical protein